MVNGLKQLLPPFGLGETVKNNREFSVVCFTNIRFDPEKQPGKVPETFPSSQF